MFTKWRSVENYYNRKVIDKIMLLNPGLEKETFLITEKIHGSNFSFTFKADGSYEVYKRTGKADDNFYHWKEILERDDIQQFLVYLSDYCELTKRSLQFVGELFGPGVQKEVYYGPSKNWRWYAIYEHKDGESRLLTISESFDIAEEIAIQTDYNPRILFVPIIKKMFLLQNEDFIEKLKTLDIARNSTLTPSDYEQPNIMEGVVIRPMNKDYYHGGNEESTIFIVKYKNEAFLDKKKQQSTPKEEKKYSEEFNKLLISAAEYVNETRTTDLMSKEGELSDMKEFGKYLGLYMKDVMTDFAKERGEELSQLSKEEQKQLNRSVNALIAKELKRYVSQG